MNYSLNKSLNLLKQKKFYAILVHNSFDLLLDGGRYISDNLNKFKQQGLVKNIGVSVYDSENLIKICEILNPDIVQLPINVLDQRFINDGRLKYLKNKNIEIHARSIYLQGLLLMNSNSIDPYFNSWKHVLNKWHKDCTIQNFTPLHAALDFIIKIKEIDYCILGIQNMSQLKESISFINKNRNFDATSLGCSDNNFINPSKWRLS